MSFTGNLHSFKIRIFFLQKSRENQKKGVPAWPPLTDFILRFILTTRRVNPANWIKIKSALYQLSCKVLIE